MAYKRKTKDLWEVQGNYGYGWDTETASESYKEARQDLKDYRSNVRNAQFRLIKRRIPIKKKK